MHRVICKKNAYKRWDFGVSGGKDHLVIKKRKETQQFCDFTMKKFNNSQNWLLKLHVVVQL